MPASLPSGWRIEDSPRSACHGRLLDAEGTPLADLYVDPSVPPALDHHAADASGHHTPPPPALGHRPRPLVNAWRRYGCHQESQEKWTFLLPQWSGHIYMGCPCICPSIQKTQFRIFKVLPSDSPIRPG